jgi:hypothetical protein
MMLKKSSAKPMIRFSLIFFFIISLAILALALTYQKITKQPTINGVLLLSENTGDITGYYKWEEALDAKDFKAIVKPKPAVLAEHPEYFRDLAAKGYEVATGYGEAPFWNMPYEEQLTIMKEYKESAEAILGQPIKIFSSKYFAYDENTLKAADALGIPYILGRGSDIQAVIYAPQEYQARILSVSNLVFGEMGSGSLCDVSLFQRGSTAEDFAQVLQESLDQQPRDLVLVSHVYIGGTRVGWWDVYEQAINSQQVNWQSFDDWAAAAQVISAPYSDIPFNDEVKYVEPKPAVPLEEIELLPALHQNTLKVFHNGQGEMCLQFLEFADTIDYPLEEHLVTDADFRALLTKYQTQFGQSQGVSETFGYYPIIFINDQAFSGFNEEVKAAILREIEAK